MPDNKASIPVKIDAHGLSPDSIYIIPLKIKSVSEFEINEDKSNVLFRLYLKNDYCEIKTTTNYFMRGELINDSEPDKIVPIAASKQFLPLDSNMVRGFPTTVPMLNELEHIDNKAMVLKIAKDNTVTILPYKNLEIESLDNSYYDPKEKKFYLNYRVKLDDEWNTVAEVLRSL